MRVLIGCEFSGVVRRAFRDLGHDAWSCDILPAEDGSPHHHQGDLFEFLETSAPFSLAIFHPPCTHIAVSGAAWFKQKIADGRQQQGIDFFMKCTQTWIPRVCIENPVCIMSRLYRKPDQIVQPYQFGDPVTKTTCLWLKGLPKLTHTNVVEGSKYVTYPSGKRSPEWHANTGGGCGHKRSIFFPGIAEAMAEQWGSL